MKIAVLGATGMTGIELVRQALMRNHEVTAIVRDPNKMTIKDDKLQVVEGNIFNEESLTEIMKDKEAVVSCLGFPRNPQPVMGFYDSARTLISAMRKNNVSRFVTMTSWYTDPNESKGIFVRWILLPLLLRPMLEGMRKMEKDLEENYQDINYTVVRPPQLTNGPLTDKEIQVKEGEFYVDIKGAAKTSRADVARFMLDCLEKKDYDKKMVAITTGS